MLNLFEMFTIWHCIGGFKGGGGGETPLRLTPTPPSGKSWGMLPSSPHQSGVNSGFLAEISLAS